MNSIRADSDTVKSTSRVVVTICLTVVLVAVCAQPVTRAQESNGVSAAKGALIGALIGGGVSLVIVAIEKSRDKDFRIRPAALDFPDTKVGESRDQSLVVRNTGTQRIQIVSVGARGASKNGAFTVMEVPQVPAVLQPGGEVKVTLRFTPGSSERFSDVVDVRVTKYPISQLR